MLLVGIYNGAATVEDSLAIPQKVKPRDFPGSPVVRT